MVIAGFSRTLYDFFDARGRLGAGLTIGSIGTYIPEQ
jgi:hypothetical protein